MNGFILHNLDLQAHKFEIVNDYFDSVSESLKYGFILTYFLIILNHPNFDFTSS